MNVVSAALKRYDGGAIVALVKDFGHEVVTVTVCGPHCTAVSVADNSFGRLTTKEVELTPKERELVYRKCVSLARTEVTAAKKEFEYWQAPLEHPDVEKLLSLAGKQLVRAGQRLGVASSAASAAKPDAHRRPRRAGASALQAQLASAT